jgi:hypothetical protein
MINPNIDQKKSINFDLKVMKYKQLSINKKAIVLLEKRPGIWEKEQNVI